MRGTSASSEGRCSASMPAARPTPTKSTQSWGWGRAALTTSTEETARGDLGDPHHAAPVDRIGEGAPDERHHQDRHQFGEAQQADDQRRVAQPYAWYGTAT